MSQYRSEQERCIFLLLQCVRDYANPNNWDDGRFSRMNRVGREHAVRSLKEVGELPDSWQISTADQDELEYLVKSGMVQPGKLLQGLIKSPGLVDTIPFLEGAPNDLDEAPTSDLGLGNEYDAIKTYDTQTFLHKSGMTVISNMDVDVTFHDGSTMNLKLSYLTHLEVVDHDEGIMFIFKDLPWIVEATCDDDFGHHPLFRDDWERHRP